MKKILIGLLVALMVALGFTAGGATLTATPESPAVVKAVAPAPAAAAWGTSVAHASDDSGYARAIHVVCNTGKHVYLQRGQQTFMGSTEAESCSLSGVDRIIVAYNQTVYCKNYAPPYQNRYFYTGTTNFGSNQTWKCYDQWPL